MNTERMDGKVIVITGAGSGMGAAMAKDFAARGAGIAILDLDEARGMAVAERIQSANGKAVYKKQMLQTSRQYKKLRMRWSRSLEISPPGSTPQA